MKNAINTKHNLDFLAKPWERDESIVVYKVGTCHGQYTFTKKGIELISVINDSPHNGHLNDVFEWFEYAAKTQNLNLYIRGFLNNRFRNHCITKRGFSKLPT